MWNENCFQIISYKTELIDLFTKANIPDPCISFDEKDRADMFCTFEVAIGNFRYAIQKNFFPNYWLTTIATAPFKFFNRLDQKNITVKKLVKYTSAIIYWALLLWDLSAVFIDTVQSPLNEFRKMVTPLLEHLF